MLPQRLATGATGVKQARYNIQAKGGSEALVRACAVYTQPFEGVNTEAVEWKCTNYSNPRTR